MQPYHEAWLTIHKHRTRAWLSARLKDGFDVHHIDGDHYNNDPRNLVLIECLDHMRLHCGAGLRKFGPLVFRRPINAGKNRKKRPLKGLIPPKAPKIPNRFVTGSHDKILCLRKTLWEGNKIAKRRLSAEEIDRIGRSWIRRILKHKNQKWDYVFPIGDTRILPGETAGKMKRFVTGGLIANWRTDPFAEVPDGVEMYEGI